MTFTAGGILMEVSDEQPEKAYPSIFSTDDGISILTRLSHFSKANAPMILTGILMEVSETHSEKAPPSIFSTDEGTSILTRRVQKAKALSPMIFTDDGILMEVSDKQ